MDTNHVWPWLDHSICLSNYYPVFWHLIDCNSLSRYFLKPEPRSFMALVSVFLLLPPVLICTFLSSSSSHRFHSHFSCLSSFKKSFKSPWNSQSSNLISPVISLMQDSGLAGMPELWFVLWLFVKMGIFQLIIGIGTSTSLCMTSGLNQGGLFCFLLQINIFILF